jgi:hypothetical protein
VGEPVEGGVGATTHSAHNQRGGWRRGGDALGAGEEGGTEEGHRECWGQTTGEREGGGGKNNNGRTAPAAGQGKIAVLANLWAMHFFWNSFFRQRIGKNIYVYALFGETKLR